MRRLAVIAAVCGMISGVYAAGVRYRDFTDTEGRTIRGCVVAFDAASGSVKFERDNRKKVTVPITVFCAEDQTYIRNDELLRNFTAGSQFKISAERVRKTNKEESKRLHNKKIDVVDTQFEIQLENRSGSTFEGLTLEYCVFYQQEVTGQGKNESKEGVKYGSVDIPSMVPKAKRTFFTDTVHTYKEELDSGWYYYSGSGNVQNGEVHGVWIRVSLKVPGRLKESIEFSYPDSIQKSRSWASSSTRVGMN